MHLRSKRIRVTHDVTIDIAAGGQRGHCYIITATDDLLEVTLKDAMQLKGLASGQLQRIKRAVVG